MSNHIIENVTLIETGQYSNRKFSWKEKHPTLGTSTWITLLNTTGLKIGDQGRLIYRTNSNSGLWYFEKYISISD